jgi:hypothetical protein
MTVFVLFAVFCSRYMSEPKVAPPPSPEEMLPNPLLEPVVIVPATAEVPGTGVADVQRLRLPWAAR